MRNLIMTGGGTAGHCIPALSLLPYLEKQFDNVYYVGSETGIEREIVAKTHVNYYSVPTVKLKRSLSAANLAIPIKLAAGVVAAKKLIKQLQPCAVFSKGGYVALPVCIAAGRMKIPLVIHESDMTMGLANKISARYAREILTSFKSTAEISHKAVWTGAPISPSLFGTSRSEGRQRYGIKSGKPVLLVMGGSSGSTAINCEIRGILPILTQKYTVLHLTGAGNASSYHANCADYVQVEFEPEMRYAYAAADLAVSRAGSNCIFELLAMHLPALLIPLPRAASRGDQIDNARYFRQNGCFGMLLQECLTPQRLVNEIDAVYANRLKMTVAQHKQHRPGNEEIARRIVRASLS